MLSILHKIQSNQHHQYVNNITTLDWLKIMKLSTSYGSILIGEYSPITIQSYVSSYTHILSVQHLNMLLAVLVVLISIQRSHSWFINIVLIPLGISHIDLGSMKNYEHFCAINEIRITRQSKILTIRPNTTDLPVKANQTY